MDKIPVVPRGRKVKRTSVSLPPDLWEELAAAAKHLSEKAKEEGTETFDRDAVIDHACRWWLQSYWEEVGRKRGK